MYAGPVTPSTGPAYILVTFSPPFGTGGRGAQLGADMSRGPICVRRRAPLRVRGAHRSGRWRGGERGQAMVEFALVAPVFLLLVAGIIQFGVGLNYWLDLQRIANQGARWAAVNCGNTGGGFNPCSPTLKDYLEQEELSAGNDASAFICYEAVTGPGGTATIGDPVTVELTTPFTFVPIVGLGTIDLKARTTMRLEQRPTNPGLLSVIECPA